MYEVQTYTIFDGWVNCWSVDGKPETYKTYNDAHAAIYEFFADLARYGMVENYSLDDYRIVEITDS